MATANIWNNEVVSSNQKTFSWNYGSQYVVTDITIYIQGAASGTPKNLYDASGNPIADINSHTSYSIPGVGNSGSYSVKSASTGTFYIRVTVTYEDAASGSTFTISNGTTGENVVYVGDISRITFSNTQGLTGLTHKVTWKMTNTINETKTHTATSASGASILDYRMLVEDWLDYIPFNSRTGTCTVTVQTFKGSTSQGTTTKTFNLWVPNTTEFKPIIGSFTAEEGSAWFNNKPWKTWSTVLQSWSGCMSKYNASLASWVLTGPGFTSERKTGTWISGAATHQEETSIMQSAGTQQWTLTIKDSRGLSASATVSLTVSDYELPVISSTSCSRMKTQDFTPDPSSVYIGGSMAYSIYNTTDGNYVDTAQIQIQISGTYVPINTSETDEVAVSGSTYIYSAQTDLARGYKLRFIVTDAMGGSTSVEGYVGTAYVFMRWDKTLNAFGFGAYPPSSNGNDQVYINPDWNLYVHGDEIEDLIENKIQTGILDQVYPVGSIYITMDGTNPAQTGGIFQYGTWVAVDSGRFLVTATGETNGTPTYNGAATGGKTGYNLVANAGAMNGDISTYQYWTAASSDFQKGNTAANRYMSSSFGSADAITNANSGNSTVVTERTGQTSTTTTIVPPYLAVYMWRRTA